MMSLQVQILSFIASFLFGVLFAFLVNFHYELLFSKKKWFQIVMNFIFVIDMALLYFLVLKWLNGGIVHLYFYGVILLGFLTSYSRTKKVRGILAHLTKKKKVL